MLYFLFFFYICNYLHTKYLVNAGNIADIESRDVSRCEMLKPNAFNSMRIALILADGGHEALIFRKLFRCHVRTCTYLSGL